MLSTATKMAAKLAEATADPKIKQSDIANACGVTKQAVQGWLKTGRFDKKHLPKLAQLTGRPLAWWLDADSDLSTGELIKALSDWRSQASARSQYVIDQLSSLAQLNALQDEDWLLLQAMAQRLASSAQRQADPQDRPLEITAEAQEAIDNRVREAQDRREQTNQQQSHRPAKGRAT